jgi:hypothetical protein
MGLLTTTEDPDLEDAREQVVPTELVCPGCQAPFTSSGETLRAFNAPLGIEAHECPACGATLSHRRPGAGGF